MMVNMANVHRSYDDMVSTLPNRNVLSSGTYPGVRNTNSTPMAIPSAQMTAIAESSRTRPRADSHSTPNDEHMANIAAMKIGLTLR